MPTLRTLLVALLLPVLVLPEGIVVCLHRLVGDEAPRPCCTSCCGAARDAQATPAFKGDQSANCCLALPATDRSIDASAKKSAADSAHAITAAAIAPPAPIAPPLPRSHARFVRAPATAAPPPVSFALPLRL